MGESGLGRTIDIASGATLLLALTGLAVERVRVRVRVRIPSPGGGTPPRWLTRALSALGFLVALASPAGATGRRNGSPLPVSSRASETPWSETSGVPPPLVRAGANAEPWEGLSDRLHPAIHSARRPSVRLAPLFPRQGRPHRLAPAEPDPASSEGPDRAESMRMHPAGKGVRRGDRLPTLHRVARGESLWTIAEEALGTQDPVRVARYWHRIHRTNRAVIGADPNLLQPGQQLTLPTENA